MSITTTEQIANDPFIKRWFQRMFGPINWRKKYNSELRKVERQSKRKARMGKQSIRDLIATATSVGQVNALLRNQSSPKFKNASDDTFRKWERAAQKRIRQLEAA